MGSMNKELDLYIDTPKGIFTNQGQWFHISEKQVNYLAEELLELYSFSNLITVAHTWISSTNQLTIILSMAIGYFTQNMVIAVLVGFLFHLFWNFNKSAFISRKATKALNIVTHDTIPVLCTVIVLSFFGMEQMYIELIIGLSWFIVLRFNLISKLEDVLYIKAYPGKMMLNDHLLLFIIIKYSLAHGISSASIEEMEKRMHQAITKSMK